MKDTIELAFIRGKDTVETADLVDSAKSTKSISTTLKEKIAKIKADISRLDIRSASSQEQE